MVEYGMRRYYNSRPFILYPYQQPIPEMFTFYIQKGKFTINVQQTIDAVNVKAELYNSCSWKGHAQGDQC